MREGLEINLRAAPNGTSGACRFRQEASKLRKLSRLVSAAFLPGGVEGGDSFLFTHELLETLTSAWPFQVLTCRNRYVGFRSFLKRPLVALRALKRGEPGLLWLVFQRLQSPGLGCMSGHFITPVSPGSGIRPLHYTGVSWFGCQAISSHQKLWVFRRHKRRNEFEPVSADFVLVPKRGEVPMLFWARQSPSYLNQAQSPSTKWCNLFD